jgi:hypothetical protein
MRIGLSRRPALPAFRGISVRREHTPQAALYRTTRSTAFAVSRCVRYSWHQGRWVCVVVVVDETTGGGCVVVVCSVTVVRVTGGGLPQPASTAVPATNAIPIASPKRDVMFAMSSLLRVGSARLVTGP